MQWMTHNRPFGGPDIRCWNYDNGIIEAPDPQDMLALAFHEAPAGIVMYLGGEDISKNIARIPETSPRTVEAYYARLLKIIIASKLAEQQPGVGGMPR